MIYVRVLPFAAIQHAPADRVATAVMEAILGSKGAGLMAAAIVISTFGCMNGMSLAGARVYYAMAKDRLFFPRWQSQSEVPYARRLADGPGGMGLPADAERNL